MYILYRDFILLFLHNYLIQFDNILYIFTTDWIVAFYFHIDFLTVNRRISLNLDIILQFFYSDLV